MNMRAHLPSTHQTNQSAGMIEMDDADQVARR
jgi:hypothetical protein